MSNKLVRLHRVGKRYAHDRNALQNISFDLDRGEFAYITGANGAGKTTLLKLLFAMEKASEGSIVVNNRDIANLPKGGVSQYRRDVGFVFQDFKLLPDLTIYENVSLPLEIRKMTKSEVDYRVRGVLSLVGLSDRAKDFPQMLSGGEQQRIAIARAIVNHPAILLADEPTGNLDTENSKAVLEILRDLNERLGQTILMITHNPEAAAYAHRTVRMRDGKLTGQS